MATDQREKDILKFIILIEKETHKAALWYDDDRKTLKERLKDAFFVNHPYKNIITCINVTMVYLSIYYIKALLKENQPGKEVTIKEIRKLSDLFCDFITHIKYPYPNQCFNFGSIDATCEASFQPQGSHHKRIQKTA